MSQCEPDLREAILKKILNEVRVIHPGYTHSYRDSVESYCFSILGKSSVIMRNGEGEYCLTLSSTNGTVEFSSYGDFGGEDYLEQILKYFDTRRLYDWEEKEKLRRARRIKEQRKLLEELNRAGSSRIPYESMVCGKSCGCTQGECDHINEPPCLNRNSSSGACMRRGGHGGVALAIAAFIIFVIIISS